MGSKTMVEDVKLPAEATRRGSFARVIHGVLDADDCNSLLRAINAKGFTPALLNIGGGKQQLAPEYRDGFRVIVDSVPLTSYILDVLRPYLPAQLGKSELVSLNDRCRFLCYTPGQEFPEHHDACYKDKKGNFSTITVQIYLHDVPAEHGGATTFLFDDSDHRVECQPSMGSALIFTQDLLHEGSLLKRGLKYTFRTEAMYRRIRS